MMFMSLTNLKMYLKSNKIVLRSCCLQISQEIDEVVHQSTLRIPALETLIITFSFIGCIFNIKIKKYYSSILTMQ